MDPQGRRYILLPKAGLRATRGPALDTLLAMPLVRSTSEGASVTLDAARGRSVEIIDSAMENGPRLVRIDEDAAAALNDPGSPLRAVPEIEYRRPDLPPPPATATAAVAITPTAASAASAAPTTVTVTCTDGATGQGLPGVEVVALTDDGARQRGWTDASGDLSLSLTGTNIQRVVAVPPPGYWGAANGPIPMAPAVTLPLTPVDLSFTDCLRHYYGSSKFDATAGVRVGVIDTGVGPHTLLNLTGGSNTVTGESASDFADGALHGTHVAGMIGADGAPPQGLRGMAPGVEIQAYRVFPPGGGATNYAILKALIYAANERCDIVNLSLGGGPAEPIVAEAITDARNSGMLVVVATGNDGRQPVSYPAAYVGATAVTAMGRQGTWPAGSTEDGFVERPPNGSADPAEFMASFSNVGPQVAITAPGVGVLSTLPNNQFGPMSGTSMAAPAVAGAAACLLSGEPVIHALARDGTRSQAIANLVAANCTQRGFGQFFEGAGMPDPAKI